MKLSIIVPVYNESTELEAVIEKMMAAPCPIEREWLLVDDASTDGSLDILKRLAASHGFRVLEQGSNQGKGAAIIRAIPEAAGDLVLIQDADLEYEPGDIPSLLQPLLQDQADAVYGSRFMGGGAQSAGARHYLANRFLTVISNLLSGLRVTDMETCYKVFRADLLKAMNLQSKRFGIEVELTAYLAKAKVRVREVPIKYNPRSHLEGKKINWMDGVAALMHLVRFNLLTSRARAFRGLPERYR